MNNCSPSCKRRGTPHVHQSRNEGWFHKADTDMRSNSQLRERVQRLMERLQGLRDRPAVDQGKVVRVAARVASLQRRVDSGSNDGNLLLELEQVGAYVSDLEASEDTANTPNLTGGEVPPMSKLRVPSASSESSSTDDTSEGADYMEEKRFLRAVASQLKGIADSVEKSFPDPVDASRKRRELDEHLNELQRALHPVPQDALLRVLQLARDYITSANVSKSSVNFWSVDWTKPLSEKQRSRLIKEMRTRRSAEEIKPKGKSGPSQVRWTEPEDYSGIGFYSGDPTRFRKRREAK